MKRRLLLALVLAVAVVSAGAASAASFGNFLVASNTTGPTTAIDSGGSRYVAVHIWRHGNAAASTSVVYLQGSLDKVNWVRMATFTNATGMDATYGDGGDGVSVASWPFMRLYTVSVGAGTLNCKWMVR